MNGGNKDSFLIFSVFSSISTINKPLCLPIALYLEGVLIPEVVHKAVCIVLTACFYFVNENSFFEFHKNLK